jgi:YegS/Rv2252/BmrU family lipid kinase
MKFLAIINPKSSNGKTGWKLSKIITAIDKINSKYIVTDSSGHAFTCTKSAESGTCFISCGGDGTINEIINGMNPESQSLAILPLGTGNSLARDLGIRNIDAGIKAIQNNKFKKIDLLMVEYKRANGESGKCYSASTIAVGYVANVVQLANMKLKALGPLCYSTSAFFNSLLSIRKTYNISINSNAFKQKTLTGYMVSNTRFAGNFEAFPNAIINDGRFDVMETNAPLISQIVHNISILTRTHFYKPYISYTAKTISLSSKSPYNLLIDGEIISDVTDITISILPEKISCYTIH